MHKLTLKILASQVCVTSVFRRSHFPFAPVLYTGFMPWLYMLVCMYVFVYVYMYVCIYEWSCAQASCLGCTCWSACVYLCIYLHVCMCVYIYIYIYIYIYMSAHVHRLHALLYMFVCVYVYVCMSAHVHKLHALFVHVGLCVCMYVDYSFTHASCLVCIC